MTQQLAPAHDCFDASASILPEVRSQCSDGPGKSPFTLTDVEGQPRAVLNRTLVAQLRGELPCQSKEVVMEVLGISANTWLKIKRGQPIRPSLAERLAKRMGWLN